MKIQRERWVITHTKTNKIFCGRARNYGFRYISEIGDAAITTYPTRNRAIASFKASYWTAEKLLASGDVKAVKVIEVFEFEKEAGDNGGNT